MKKVIDSLSDLWENSKTSIGIFLGSILFIGYSIKAVRYEIGEGWRGHPSVQGVLTDISRAIPVAGASVATLIGGIDLIVFLLSLYVYRKERMRKKIEAARAEGYAARQQEQDSGNNQTG